MLEQWRQRHPHVIDRRTVDVVEQMQVQPRPDRQH
jgi:hypothetical protein